jgi:hypothetical protein
MEAVENSRIGTGSRASHKVDQLAGTDAPGGHHGVPAKSGDECLALLASLTGPSFPRVTGAP